MLGGKARRKKLLSPKGMDVRPMMEVVKGAAFDILQVLVLILILKSAYVFLYKCLSFSDQLVFFDL